MGMYLILCSIFMWLSETFAVPGRESFFFGGGGGGGEGWREGRGEGGRVMEWLLRNDTDRVD